MDFHREFLDEPAEKYELTYRGEEALAGRTTHLVQAQPREPGRFKEARIWLDAARFLILKVQIEEENGSVRTVALSEIDWPPLTIRIGSASHPLRGLKSSVASDGIPGRVSESRGTASETQGSSGHPPLLGAHPIRR